MGSSVAVWDLDIMVGTGWVELDPDELKEKTERRRKLQMIYNQGGKGHVVECTSLSVLLLKKNILGNTRCLVLLLSVK